MRYATRDVSDVVLDMVGTFGPWGSWMNAPASATPGSTTFEAAGRTLYYPIWVPTYANLRRFWYLQGGTAGAGNLIIAIYGDADHRPGVRVATTGTATQSVTNRVVFVTPTTTPVLDPGPYWMALGGSATTLTFFSQTAPGESGDIVKLQEATGTPPSTATPAKSVDGKMYVFGFSTVDSP